MKHQSGFNNPNAFLTDTEVKEIISLYNLGKHTQTALAELYKVSQSQISRIIKGIRRTHKA